MIYLYRRFISSIILRKSID